MPTAYVDGRDRDRTRTALTALAQIAEACRAAGRRGDVTLLVDEMHVVAADPELACLLDRIATAGRTTGIEVRPRQPRQYATIQEFEAA
jgi:hypothetical protein